MLRLRHEEVQAAGYALAEASEERRRGVGILASGFRAP